VAHFWQLVCAQQLLHSIPQRARELHTNVVSTMQLKGLHHSLCRTDSSSKKQHKRNVTIGFRHLSVMCADTTSVAAAGSAPASSLGTQRSHTPAGSVKDCRTRKCRRRCNNMQHSIHKLAESQCAACILHPNQCIQNNANNKLLQTSSIAFTYLQQVK
jgi:hypothetical protein